jgi:DNA-binding transcriptional MerR regulator
MTAAARRRTSADDPDGGLMGIQEVAKELGVTMRALRFYEDKGLIAPQRVGTTRIYGRREVARVRLVLRGRRLGFTVREIKEFLDLYDADPEHVEQMRRFTLRVRQRIEEMEQRKRALEETIEELRALEKEALTNLNRASQAAPTG